VTWRVGRKLGRTIYIQEGPEPSDLDLVIGMMDAPSYAHLLVDAVNGQEAARGQTRTLEEERDHYKAQLQVAIQANALLTPMVTGDDLAANLSRVMNYHSIDSRLGAPDHLLGAYLRNCLTVLEGLLREQAQQAEVRAASAILDLAGDDAPE
jgi:hypothetical protein